MPLLDLSITPPRTAGATAGASAGSGLAEVELSLGRGPTPSGTATPAGAATPPVVALDLTLGGATTTTASAGATGATGASPGVGATLTASLGSGATLTASLGSGAAAGASPGVAVQAGVGTGLTLGTVDLGGGVGGIGVGTGVGVLSAGGGSGGGSPTGGGTGGGAPTGGGAGAGGGASGGGGGATGTAAPDPHTAFVNIFRLSGPSQIPADVELQLKSLDAQISSGALTAKQAVLKIVDAAAGFTAVAETTYQFFSGLTPTAAGLTYLVNSSGNPADLSDRYYEAFNLENRYINFASNLGLHSDHAPEFARVFGAMSFNDAVATAYERIVGSTAAAAAGIDPAAAIADIAARRPYFEAVAHERFGGDDFGLSTKLAAVAYIMEEAVRANVGAYGEANQNFLYDLADGAAQFNVNLVGMYGHGTPLDVV